MSGNFTKNKTKNKDNTTTTTKDKNKNGGSANANIRITFDEHKTSPEPAKKGGKSSEVIKVNKYNSGGVKQAIDDIICEFLLDRTNREEDNATTNTRIVLSFMGCVLAVIAQFHTYFTKFNVPLIVACVSLYGLISLALAYVMRFKVKDTIIAVSSAKFFAGVKDSGSEDEIVVSTDIEEFDTKYTVTLSDSGSSVVKSQTTLTKVFDTTKWIDVEGVVHKNVVANDFSKHFAEFLKAKLHAYKIKRE